ncbi:hypothetical protein V8F20_004472 [Naviculisporaceae sp. PSN 640]
MGPFRCEPAIWFGKVPLCAAKVLFGSWPQISKSGRNAAKTFEGFRCQKVVSVTVSCSILVTHYGGEFDKIFGSALQTANLPGLNGVPDRRLERCSELLRHFSRHQESNRVGFHFHIPMTRITFYVRISLAIAKKTGKMTKALCSRYLCQCRHGAGGKYGSDKAATSWMQYSDDWTHGPDRSDQCLLASTAIKNHLDLQAFT